MFRKIHLRLAALCAGITVLILLIMSCGFLYISEKSLRDNHFHAFQNRMELLAGQLAAESLLTPEWFAQATDGENYLIRLTDNGIPLLMNRSDTSESTALFDAAWKRYEELFLIYSQEPYSTFHQEFSFSSRDTGSHDYYACAIISNRPSGTLQATILMPLKNLSQQIRTQRIRFLILDTLAVIALSLFSWHFTWRLLLPLEENQKRQSQFIASASHELRTPLAVILSCASAAGRADAGEQAHFLSAIHSEGLRMSGLIDDMLFLSSADNLAWSIRKTPVELDTLLLEAYEAFEPMAAEKGIRIQADLPEILFSPCLCDKDRIRQVLSILLHNAITYTPEKGCIHLSLSQTGKYYSLAVADNGSGIPDAQKKRIFERFYQADPARSQKGHFGLGLCIAQEIVSAHHGQIRLEDTPGGGSTFTVLLPDD